METSALVLNNDVITMKKRVTAIILTAVMLTATFAVCFSAFANDIQWSYDSLSKTLYITGSGDMESYDEAYAAPWGEHILNIEKLIIEEGVTSVGAYAFSGATSLVDAEIADSVTAIEKGAFSSTPALTNLTLSENVTSIGDVSFAKIGADDKVGFTLNVLPGSYALNYAIENEIPFNCNSVSSGEHNVKITQKTGMKAYYPYTAKVSGDFVFYSVSMDDPIGFVYSSDFVQLAKNDDHSVSLTYSGMDNCDFAIRISLEKGKTYYFTTKIFNPNLDANYKVYIKPLSYTVSGDIKAVIAKDGSLSDDVLTDATLDGVATDGSYELTITDENEFDFECGGARLTHFFSPDDGDNVDIGIVVCDVNNDCVVNAKDYARLLKTNSPYVQYIENLINYSY